MPERWRSVKKRLKKAIKKAGGAYSQEPGKGSHTKIKDGERGHVYTVPLGDGDNTELADVYIKALWKEFELD